MKKIVGVIAFCVCLTFAAQSILIGKVVGVSDGDTIKVLVDNKEVKIRLYGIDCPEKKQPFGTKAKTFTSELVFGKTVKVIERGSDRYGRVIGEVFVNDSISLNRELVKAGFAWWYSQYAPHDTSLEKLETIARSAKIGLWVDKNPEAPWEWRKKERTK